MIWLVQGAQLLLTEAIKGYSLFIHQGYIDLPLEVFNHLGCFCYHAASRSLSARFDNDDAGVLQERYLIAGMR